MIKPKRDEKAEACQQYLDILLPALRHVAYRCGYALAVHGSLRRDIDIVACPWRNSAISAQSLIRDLKKATESIIGYAQELHPVIIKDGGRRAYGIHLTCDHTGPYLDISVMPIIPLIEVPCEWIC